MPRAFWIAVAMACVLVGLAVNTFGMGLPPTARDFTGDALWASMMFAWLGVVSPRASLQTRAMVAMAVAWTVEFSQLYHGATLDAWRRTTLGRLVLGVGFDARDLGAYVIGVLAGVALESVMRWRSINAALTSGPE